MNHTDAKNNILNTVVDIMQSDQNIETLTNRQIAEKAGVNSALINYYFQSKDNLLLEAVNVCIGKLFEDIIEKTSAETDPLLRLKNMMKEMVHLGCRRYSLAKIAVAKEIDGGGIITNKMLQPILNEIFNGAKTDDELKIFAAQLLLPIQVIFLNLNSYRAYLHSSISSLQEQENLVELIFKNLSLEGDNCK